MSTPRITGFHAHVYFDEATRAEAEKIRAAVQEQFGVEVGQWHDGPAGPHTKPQYQIVFTPEQFAAVASWLMLHHEGLSILIHPRTGDEIADHSAHPLWLGEPIRIDVDFLRTYMARVKQGSGSPHANAGNGV